MTILYRRYLSSAAVEILLCFQDICGVQVQPLPYQRMTFDFGDFSNYW